MMNGTPAPSWHLQRATLAALCILAIQPAFSLSGCLITTDEQLWQQTVDAAPDQPAADHSAAERSADATADGEGTFDGLASDTPLGEAPLRDGAIDAAPDTVVDSAPAPDTAVDSAPDTTIDANCRQMVLTVTSNADDGEVAGGSLLLDGEGGTVLMGTWGASSTWAFFRFNLDQALPATATITSATVDLWGSDQQQWDPRSHALQIWAEDAADAPWVAKSGDAPFLANGRPVTSAMVRWPAAGGLYWKVDQRNVSPDLKALFQELVDTYGGLARNAKVQLWIRGEHAANAEVGTHNFLEAHYTAEPHRLTLGWCE